MTFCRAWISMAGVLFLASTVQAQVSRFPEFDPNFRTAWLNDQQPMRSPMLEDSGPTSNYRPGLRTPAVTTAKSQETVQTPEPAPWRALSNGYEQAAAGGWCDDCSNCIPSCYGCCNHWYAYVGGLAMGRDTPNKTWTTFDQTNLANQLVAFPGANWGGGVDTRIGYWFGCGSCGDPCNSCSSCGPGGRFGIEAVYYGVWGLDGQSGITDPTNQLGTVQNDGLVGFVNPDDASLWFDNAHRVRLTRDDEFHNVEINFMYLPCCDSCSRFQMTALAGVRFFRFSEGLEWDQFADPANVPVGFSDEAITKVDVQNNLVGFQIGAYMNYRVCNSVCLFAAPKIGIFGNHINAHNSMALADGTQATLDANGDVLSFHNVKDVFSMMGSIDVGVNWAFAPNWSFVGGYRVVAVTGVALGDNQVPQFFADEAGWKNINTNGSLILHGAFAGVQCRF
jgi:Putative beta barrel porin-7 (BBP7)